MRRVKNLQDSSLNLEKKRALQGQIQKLIVGNQEIIDQNKMQNELQYFYRNLFKSNCTKSYDCKKFLDKFTTPVLTSKKANICEGDLVESALFKSPSSMQDCKSSGNDRLRKEFYEYFWNVMKDPFMNSIKEARKNKKLSIYQQQAVIKLIEKRHRDKCWIKNWLPISLLTLDYKIMSKAHIH